MTPDLNDPTVRDAPKQTWLDSQPGITGGHEEGGFILRDETGKITVARWPKGEQDEIRKEFSYGSFIDRRSAAR
jgi:hypothetical protein